MREKLIDALKSAGVTAVMALDGSIYFEDSPGNFVILTVRELNFLLSESTNKSTVKAL